MQPPPLVKKLLDAHLGKRPVGQVPAPFILDFGDLARVFVVEDVDDAVDGLFLFDPFHDVARAHVQDNGVARRLHLVGQTFDLSEDGWQAVPLRLVLFASLGFCDRVFEYGRVLP